MNIYKSNILNIKKQTFTHPVYKTTNIQRYKYYPVKCSEKIVDIVDILSHKDNIENIMSTMTPDQCRLVSELSTDILFHEFKELLVIVVLVIMFLNISK